MFEPSWSTETPPFIRKAVGTLDGLGTSRVTRKSLGQNESKLGSVYWRLFIQIHNAMTGRTTWNSGFVPNFHLPYNLTLIPLAHTTNTPSKL
ncbi:hypothetical protein PHLCEN_2v4254 [Hermanssonia centrifuga]|uniref:Uncharacterized protein n=1 Tax=Hermanssonia centrifuga TaxID=98765 RepID=A0A2R6PYV2_9APHY|nr:hypothetical protein PHLCEN_2v4254 [Hermanssonia centrifuga]